MSEIYYLWNFKPNEKSNPNKKIIKSNQRFLLEYQIIKPKQILPLVKKYSVELFEMWNLIPHWIIQVDLARLLQIYYCSHIYLDLDCLIKKNFLFHFEKKNVILFVEKIIESVDSLGPLECKNPENVLRIANYAFGSQKIKHPFFKEVIDECIIRLKKLLSKANRLTHQDILWVCGPDVMTTIYLKSHKKYADLILLNQSYLNHKCTGSWRTLNKKSIIIQRRQKRSVISPSLQIIFPPYQIISSPHQAKNRTTKILINHCGARYHFEIIFTILKKYSDQNQNTIFYFKPKFLNRDRQNLIKKRMPDIQYRIRKKIKKTMALTIWLTVYPKDHRKISKYKDNPKFLFICHKLTNRYQHWKNVYYLTPLARHQFLFLPSFFPYSKVKPDYSRPPIYLIQGNIDINRRNYRSLIPIFKQFANHSFKIKILGRGQLPNYLRPYQNKIEFKSDLSDSAYYKAIKDCTFILPLVDESFKHYYFTKKLTSSISYGLGFGLIFVVHQQLANIYQLNQSTNFVYDQISNFTRVFDQSLDYYDQSLSKNNSK